VQQSVVVGLMSADFAEPPNGVAIELELVDCLARADIAKLWWPVRREHDHRHARLVGLDHRRVQVRRRGPGRAEHRGRDCSGERGAEREEPGAALVQDHRHIDLGLPPEGDGQRGRA
jgi:hypothetical protein